MRLLLGARLQGRSSRTLGPSDDVDVEWINLIEEKHPSLRIGCCLAAQSDSDGDKSYLVYMAARLIRDAKACLSLQARIYLHCDPTMSHYLKLVMDADVSADWAILGMRLYGSDYNFHADARRFGAI